MITKYSWQSLIKRGGNNERWATDIHSFESLEDALMIGLEDHVVCRAHSQHRVSCIFFNSETLEYVGQRPVFYLLKRSGD